MGYSSLVSYIKISPNKNSPRNHKIDSVAIHCMAGNLSVETCGDLFANPERKASSNYGIGTDGRIALYVDENDRSWCTSSGGVDHRAITIEVANSSIGDPWPVSDAAYQSLLNLLTDICRRHQISSLKWMASKEYAAAAANGGPVDQQNMFVHRWFANKACPGDYLYNAHGAIATEVNKRLASGAPIIPGNSLVVPTVTIDKSKLKPYVPILDRDSPTPNYDQFRKNGVVGAIVEAGYQFTSAHIRVENFRNPKAYDQVQALISERLPFGYYMIARARNLSEVREEIYQLSFLIRKYSPGLGVWLQLDLPPNQPDVNDAILNAYKTYLIKLGLVGKIGIYADSITIKRINWSKHYHEWLLWYVERVSGIGQLFTVFDSSFFSMSGRYT